MNNAKEVLDALEAINTATGSAKERLLRQFTDCALFRRVVLLAYDHTKRFNTTKVTYVPDSRKADFHAALDFLEALAKRRGLTASDQTLLNDYASVDRETVDVLRRIVNKDLRIGVGAKTVKKVCPELPFYEIMLCIKDPRSYLRHNIWGGSLWSVKMNGVRDTTFVTAGGEVLHMSRSGKQYKNFDHVNAQLLEAAKASGLSYPVQFDGEFTAKNVKLQGVMKYAMGKKKPGSEDLVYTVFDVITPQPLYKRLAILGKLFPAYSGLTADMPKEGSVFALEHYLLEALLWQEVEALARGIIHKGCEGIVVKTYDGRYEQKRSMNWLKIKALYLSGEGVEEDLRVLRAEAGKPGTKYQDCLGKLICDYNGVEVAVGSGFSDAERLALWYDTPNVIEVFAEGETDDGSLQHPIFQRVRDDL